MPPHGPEPCASTNSATSAGGNSVARLTACLAPLLVALVDHREIRQVALDTRGEVVVLAPLDDREPPLAAGPRALGSQSFEATGYPRPLRPKDEQGGAAEQNQGENAHVLILVRGIRTGAFRPIRESMQQLPLALVLFIVAWATVARAVLVFTQKLPPTCGACGLRYERRYLGERVCHCD